MRILKLRFQNLNSLVGEWQIDFTHPAYIEDGIFAITGATGAGKSTILDAICLALYGATPRLSDITKSKNDLMSRQTGECFSEVVFSVNGKSYICHWGQKRARKNPSGNLQDAKHEIAPYINDLEAAPPIETQTKKTKKMVETITGMDFQRFTRAMLLAQGSFSAFLQANSDERSPILEQITGTEIYSEISKKVHEFNRQAELELKSLTDKLSGLTVLSEAEEQGLIEEKTAILANITEQKTRIEHLEQDKTWRNNLTYYQHQAAQLTGEQQAIERQITEFAPQQSRLNKALKALSVAGDVSQLQLLTQQLTKQQDDLEYFKQQLPIIEQAIHTAEQQLAHDHTALQHSETTWQNHQPIFNQVRELDTKISHQHAQWQQASEHCQRLQQQNEQKAAELSKQQTLLQQLQHEQHACQTAKHHIPHAEQLPKTLATLETLQQTLNDFIKQKSIFTQEKQQLEQAQNGTQNQQKQLAKQLQQLDTQLATQRQTLQTLESQLTDATHGETLVVLREKIDNSRQSQLLIANAQTSVQEWQRNVATLTQMANDSQNLAKTWRNVDSDLVNTERERQHASEKLELLNQNLQLLATIKSYTEDRHKLVDGEPCPLCGATLHPYATDEPPLPTEGEQAVKQAKQQVDTLNQYYQDLLLQKNNLYNQQQHLGLQQQQLVERNVSLASQLDHALAGIHHAEPLRQPLAELIEQHHANQMTSELLQNFAHLLADFATQHSEHLTHLQHRQTTIEALQQQQHAQQQHLSDLTHQSNQLRHEQTLLHTNACHRQTRLTEIHQQINSLSDKQTQLNQQLEHLWTPFKSIQTGNTPAERIAELQRLSEQHQQLSHQFAQLTEQIHHHETVRATLTAAKLHLTQNLSDYQRTQQQLSETLHQLNQQRQKLFGEKNVQTEENRLATAKQQAFEQWQASEKALQNHRHQRQTTQQQIRQATDTLAEKREQHHQLQQTINERLTALGFTDIADFHAHSLHDSEREPLQQHANLLNKKQQENSSLLNQANNNLQKLLATPRTQLTIEQITGAITEQNLILNKFQETLGGLKQRLTDNEQAKSKHAALLKNLEQKSQEAKEWKDLHELIGSNDGKKFRNFAQGLTFNIMISHANEQLKKMSERYLLLADKDQPLMLNVVDIYQDNEVRTSKNLSGGESFIISLALALGLSNMASHRMQVDSLFLDEGFGTLDEEALDVALDTLTNLQQSGKLIGVISHIQALKDRISRQIQVVPMTGGVSKIEGAGVQKLA